MRKIHPVLYLWAILFPVFSVKANPQNILESFKLTVSAAFPKNAATKSVDLDQLTQAHDPVIALFEIKDGKNQLIAAQIEKKEHCWLHWMIVSGESKKSTHFCRSIQKRNLADAGQISAGYRQPDGICDQDKKIIINQ